MKNLIVIAVFAAVMVPTHGALLQCAGTRNDRYESSGFLTSDWTQNACNALGGTIDPNKKGNQKCCNVPNSKQDQFSDACDRQKNEKFQDYAAIAQTCMGSAHCSVVRAFCKLTWSKWCGYCTLP